MTDPTTYADAGPRAGACADSGMGLCPYPALGEELSREEFCEAFCRLQHGLVRGRFPPRPDWQLNERPANLREFWAGMERRRRL